MKISAPTAFSNSAPVAVATTAAAVGTASDAARGDHRHALQAPGNVTTTQAFGDTASAGVNAGAALADHKHGMPSAWNIVTTGAVSAAAALNLSSLTGYKRYRLTLGMRGDGSNTFTPVTCTVNGDTGATYQANSIANLNATVTGLSTTAATSFGLSQGKSDNNAGTGVHDLTLTLLVEHDPSANNHIRIQWALTINGVQLAANALHVNGGGVAFANYATITAIALAWNAAATGVYVLEGSN